MTWYGGTSQRLSFRVAVGCSSTQMCIRGGQGLREQGSGVSCFCPSAAAVSFAQLWLGSSCKAQNYLNRVWIYTASDNGFNYHKGEELMWFLYSTALVQKWLLIQSSSLEISALPHPAISICLPWRPSALAYSKLKANDTVTDLHLLLHLHLRETNPEGGSPKEHCENLEGLGSVSSKAGTGWLREQKSFSVVSGDLWTAAKSQHWDLSKVAVVMGWAHCQGGRFQDLQPPGNT